MRWRERASSLWRRILSQAVARPSAFCSPWGRRASAACTSSTRSRRGTRWRCPTSPSSLPSCRPPCALWSSWRPTAAARRGGCCCSARRGCWGGRSPLRSCWCRL
ncbi:unnamed protein product [Ectocarpus sp. 12 AP-2014]